MGAEGGSAWVGGALEGFGDQPGGVFPAAGCGGAMSEPDLDVLCEAAAVIPTARHAVQELVRRLVAAGDVDAAREARAAQRAVEMVADRLSVKLGQRV